MNNHIMQRNGNILTCPICGRMVDIADGADVIIKGDSNAYHSYSNGINIIGLQVDTSGIDDIWKDAIDEAMGN